MLIVCFQFFPAHTVQFQLLFHRIQSRSCGMFRNIACVQIVNPFFQRCPGYPVKVVYFQNVIFRIELTDLVHLECLFLEWTEFQYVSFVNAYEFRLPVIYEIFAVSQGEIYNIHAVYFTHLLISFTPVDVFRYQFGRTEQHALEVRILVVVLNLDEYQLSL